MGRRGAGRPFGAPNYKNDILIEIVERYLPQGLEAWNAVALQYQRESNELTLRRGEDLRENWNKKLCNRMQKLTGKPGVNTDRMFRCIEIERRIQDEAAAVRQHHRGGVRLHCRPATTVAEGGEGGGRPKILLIANGGRSQRPWTGWWNQSKAGGGGGTVGVI